MRARIYHNDAGSFGTYDPDTADLRLVHTTEVEDGVDDLAILENLFHRYNVGDDPAFGTPDPDALAYRAKRLRSLSVGDVIVLDTNDTNTTDAVSLHRAYACATLGWEMIQEIKGFRLGTPG